MTYTAMLSTIHPHPYQTESFSLLASKWSLIMLGWHIGASVRVTMCYTERFGCRQTVTSFCTKSEMGACIKLAYDISSEISIAVFAWNASLSHYGWS